MILKYLNFADQSVIDILRLNIIQENLDGQKLIGKYIIRN
jgi:hypothetical protein